MHHQLGLPTASTAPLAKITEAFDAAVHRFTRDHQVPWVHFAKGRRKDDVMHSYLAEFEAAGATEGCCSSGGPRRRLVWWGLSGQRHLLFHAACEWFCLYSVVTSRGVL